MIVLVGFMGAGKSAVGRLLAERLGTDFTDADEVIERRAGAPVRDIFAKRGVREFRALERDAIGELLRTTSGILALGGGALEDAATRVALKETGARVAYLAVDHEAALARVGDDENRPMLGVADTESLHRSRLVHYESVADLVVDTTHLRPEEVVAAIMRGAAREVSVRVAPRPYKTVVGAGVAARLLDYIPGAGDAEKAFIVTHPELLEGAERAAASLSVGGLRPVVIDVPSGESSKSLETIGWIYDRFGKEAAHRKDLVVGVGGGVITDIAGFVASTFNRGMPVVHVPTTLLGQVDAAIGGKTGINLPHGKNLVGTFYQPSAVVCDVELLDGLPRAEMTAGMAEVIKYGFIADPRLLDVIERGAGRAVAGDKELLIDIVTRSVEIKAEVVAADEREEGGRELLNYGHTFAHAIEHIAGYGSIRHGEAVALGMMAAAHLGHALGRFDESVVEAHRRVISAAGLPVTASLDLNAMERAWERDKKYLRGVRFVLLTAIGRAESGVTAPRSTIEEALKRLSG